MNNMEHKRILGWIQIVLGAIIGLWVYFKLGMDYKLDSDIILDSSFSIFVAHQLEAIKVGILVIFVLIILQGIVNVKSKD